VLAARTIVRFIRECRDQGKTVVFSSHIMSEVARLCDRIAILHEGRIRVTGSVADLRARYQLEDMEEVFVKALEDGT
jgi:sodium transport system ATP-binding protein